MFLWVRAHLSVEMARSPDIGSGSRVDHLGCVVFESQVEVGRNPRVKPGVVIWPTDSGCPMIDDDVEAGVGAKVLAGLRVGSNMIIGAQSVEMRGAPGSTVVAGVPAPVLRSRGQSERECHEEG
ncbi:MAG TPA: hypothetical protein VLH79_15425 [Chthonomonadales bacterium]|nr:hypothetical protein [Chthonomonadales bacterium]